jgi:hypothetical protein
VLDFEGGTNNPHPQIAGDVQAWLQYVSDQKDVPVLLYTSPHVYNTWLAPFGDWMAAWPVWLAYYYEAADPPSQPFLPLGRTSWTFWEYSEAWGLGPSYGVSSTGIALSVLNGSRQDLFDFLQLDEEARNPTSVALWSLGDFEDAVLMSRYFNSSAGVITSMAFNPAGTIFAAGSETGAVQLWDIVSGTALIKFAAQQSAITSLSFSPDGEVLFIGGADGRMILWDTRWLDILFTDLDIEPWLSTACELAGRDLTEGEWADYVGTDVETTIEETCPKSAPAGEILNTPTPTPTLELAP